MPQLIAPATHKDVLKAARHPNIRNVLLAGPPGVGKTTLAFLIADLLKKQAWKIQHHAEGTPSELIGMWVPDDKKFRWEAGPLDLAYNNGGFLIHDEIVEASGPVKTFLYGCFDNGRGGELDYIGKKFKPEPGMMNFATMNGWPYEGGLPEALLDRMDATFIITKPSPKQLELLKPDLREICEDAYEKAQDPMEGPGITFRMLMSLQTLREILPLEMAVLSACQGDQKKAGAFLEVLALSDGDDDLEDDEDEDEEEDE